jgi:hypothetical protein
MNKFGLFSAWLPSSASHRAQHSQHMEHERHYVYNPYVLNLLYAKVIYLDRLRDFYLWWRAGGKREVALNEEEKRRILVDNCHDSLIVTEVVQLMEAMRSERFHFDLYYANFEYILFRMLRLFAPKRAAEYFSELCGQEEDSERLGLGDLFGCDLKTKEFLEPYVRATEKTRKRADHNRAILFLALARYVETFYFSGSLSAHHRRRTSERVSLLFNYKRQAEKRAAAAGEGGYSVVYTKDVITTMIYLLLVSECVTALREARESSQLRHDTLLEAFSSASGVVGSVDDDYHYADFTNDLQQQQQWQLLQKRTQEEIERELKLLEGLRARLSEQYENEFDGFSVVTPQTYLDITPGVTHFSHYTWTRNRRSRINALNTLPNQDGSGAEEFEIRESGTEHLQFLGLRENAHTYQYVVRRFLFDHSLKKHHRSHCLARSLNRECPCCRYLRQNEPQFQFYEQAERYAYNTCHYVQQDSPKLANEACLFYFLASVVIELVPPAPAMLFYKNMWQVLQLMMDEGVRVRAHGTQWVNMFFALDLCALAAVTDELYVVMDGGVDMRLALVLEYARRTHQRGTIAVQSVSLSQKRLAADIDMVLVLTRALARLHTEQEKFQLSLVNECEESPIYAAFTSSLIKIYEAMARELATSISQ